MLKLNQYSMSLTANQFQSFLRDSLLPNVTLNYNFNIEANCQLCYTLRWHQAVNLWTQMAIKIRPNQKQSAHSKLFSTHSVLVVVPPPSLQSSLKGNFWQFSSSKYFMHSTLLFIIPYLKGQSCLHPPSYFARIVYISSRPELQVLLTFGDHSSKLLHSTTFTSTN